MVNETILVAEGCDGHTGVVAESLRNCGHRVIIATNGEEAMARAISESPGLVIVDADAPEKDGVCICRDLKECPQTRTIKVLLLQGDNGRRQTGSTGSTGSPSQWQIDVDKVLKRPVTGDKLMDTVARLI